MTPDQWRNEGIENSNGPILDEELPHLYARAKINISIDHVVSMGYWSDRNAQIMACGGFVLFRYVPFSEMVFGDNVAYFYDKDEMLMKIDHYLNDEQSRREIADRGYTYAQFNLKVANRVRQMLKVLRYENRSV